MELNLLKQKMKSIPLKTEQSIRVNGVTKSDMVKEFKFGQTGLSMKESGSIIKHMVMECFIMRMVTFLMETGPLTKQMVTGPTIMLTEANMRVNGLTICKMDSVKKHGKIYQLMRANTSKV